ncbi:MAG: acetolactate synthase large subunit [Varibaculum sp.]|nr:acetolactate synthase large subunit [Varibaculum sp.]
MGKTRTPESPDFRRAGEKITGAQAIVKTLELLGVTDVFGIPGGAILPTFDPLMDSPIRQILVRHEQGAGHAAEGYALSSGKVGVAIVTSGPGATNLMTALADANMDSVPLLCITGQVGVEAIGTDAFQETDAVGASMPLTKHNFLVTDPNDIPAAIASAYSIASTGRPGPVLVDITKSAQNAEMDFRWPVHITLPGYKPTVKPNGKQLKTATEVVMAAHKPVIYAGGGVLRAGAAPELTELVDVTNIPVVTTLNALGAFPDSDPRNMGMPGMHGTVPAVGAMQKSDLLIAIGARFDDRVTGDLSSFAPEAKVIHIDIDPAEISKNRIADVPIVGDVKVTLKKWLPMLRARVEKDGERDYSEWYAFLNDLKQRFPLAYDPDPMGGGELQPQYVIERLSEIVGPDAIYTTGVGQHQMWAAQFIETEHPRHFITSGGLGTMGVAIPEAMGAKVANPDRVVWAIDGDGSFQMTNQELATCRVNNIPIKVALINNGVLGMVHQWQTLFYNQRYSNTDLFTDSGYIPDFMKLAEAYGCAAIRVENAEAVDEAIRQAMEINDRPVVVEFIVAQEAQVWPMVPAGASNDDIIYARDLAPVWGEE